MSNKKNNIIEEMKLMLRDKTPSLTVESLVFGEDTDPMADVDQLPPGYGEDEEMYSQGTPFESEEDDKIAQNVSEVDAEIKPLVDQIRVLALKGIAKLANNPTSSSYIMLKKIWQTVDKAAEEAVKPKNNNQQ